MAALSLSEFQALFLPNIRAMLNWELLESEDTSVSTTVISDHESLMALFTVWHVFPDGFFADWDNPSASPQTVGEALAHASSWGQNRKERINTFIGQYRLSGEPANLLVPVYRAGERHILLDSTHRVAAIASVGLPFTALLVVLNGPIDERALPDLRWHALNS